MSDFTPFPKIPRLNREIIITEKIDGTNAAIVIEQPIEDSVQPGILLSDGEWNGYVVRAQSRSRFISPEKDNHGFAAWVFKNADALAMSLGPGVHFGEWWGSGINDNYGLKEKRFSLFNVTRWKHLSDDIGGVQIRPVPTIHEGPWFIQVPGDDGCFSRVWAPNAALDSLRVEGSFAAPGFMKPEGIVVFHTAGGYLFKVTLENDERPKGSTEKEHKQ